MLRFRRKKVAKEEVAARRFVVFTAGGRDFGVDIATVIEAIRLGKVLPVPKAPAWIRGIMDLRGRVVPVVDLARRLDLVDRKDAESAAPKGVLVSLDGQIVGLGVDDVHEVIELAETAISRPDAMLSGGVGEGYLEGIGQTGSGLLLLLSVERLFTSKERNALSVVGGAGGPAKAS